jgi:uncharacterized membrane protein YobD (UPF0266 family)
MIDLVLSLALILLLLLFLGAGLFLAFLDKGPSLYNIESSTLGRLSELVIVILILNSTKKGGLAIAFS